MTIIWHVENRKISTLQDYEQNPRQITSNDYKKLVESLQQDGYHKRITVNTNGVIIGGHARKKALLDAGFKPSDEIEVIVPDRELTPLEFDRINVRDNLGYGSFDFDILSNSENFDFQDLIDWGMSESLLGVATVEHIEPSADDDAIPSTPVEPTTRLGDVWLMGEHRLMCGDSSSITDVEKLMDGRKADLVFTDPP